MAQRKPVSEREVRLKFSTDLPLDLVEKIDNYCAQNGVKKNQLAEVSFRRFFAQETPENG